MKTHAAITPQEKRIATQLPLTRLKLDDGREIGITRWAPISEMNQVPTVSIEGIIFIPKEHPGPAPTDCPPA
jgi:hypothetical protein